MSDPRSLLERESRRFTQSDGAFERLVRRRARTHRNQRIEARVLGLAIAIAVVWLGLNAIRSAPPVPLDPPSRDLGIFAPVAGRYVIGNSTGIYGIPLAPGAQIQLTSEPGEPLGWSSDGTRLLIQQWLRDGRVTNGNADTTRLIVLHADGSETVVTERRMDDEGRAQHFDGAAISPDGSHVVFATYDDPKIYIVDADGGPAEVLYESPVSDVYEPAFSPDGTKIAFVIGGGDYGHRVWVMNADGTGAHEILANETTMSVGHVDGFSWSPAGDRLAIVLDMQGGTYTFAPDGSGFTRARTTGWYLSPDGSRFASGPWQPSG